MLDTLEAALEPLALKTGKVFSGEVVAVLAPSHGHVPLYRARLPGQLVRGSRAELPSLPRPERSFWPHCQDVVRMTEVPLHIPGTRGRSLERPASADMARRSERSTKRTTHVQIQEDEVEVPYFDAEAALAAARLERTQRSESTERGRPLGAPGTPRRSRSNDIESTSASMSRTLRESQRTEVSLSESAASASESHTQSQKHGQQAGAPPHGAPSSGPGAATATAQAQGGAEVRALSIPSREPSLERDKAAQAACSRSLAQAEAMMMASIRPRPRAPKLQMVAPPPVVEVPVPAAAERRVPDRRGPGDRPNSRQRSSLGPRQSLSPARPKKSPRDLRAREKIGKLLVAHYEVRSKSLETKKWTRMLMRVILASEEKNPEALKEGLALLQNAQNLIGAGDEGESKSRVLLQALCLVDRKVKVRSPIADAVRTLEELTKRKEKLLVDMAPMGQEEASVPLHLDDTDQSLADELKKSWQIVHHEATTWKPMEKTKETASAKHTDRLKKKTEAEKEAAVEQMKKSMGTAVWRFAQAEARKVDDTDLGEEALQRAARIEYAIKAAQAQAVDSKHPDLLKALQITYDLRAFRAMRYCQHLMSTIEPGVVGSAGKVANQIDQVITDASELFGVPKDHRHMEEARHMVLKARTEEAQVKRRAK